MKKSIALLLAVALLAALLAGCGSTNSSSGQGGTKASETTSDSDQAAADKVAALIDAIYVQKRTDETDEQCAAAKAAWDALTDTQKALVSGENADPDYFSRDCKRAFICS